MVYYSNETNPYLNQCLEESLLHKVSETPACNDLMERQNDILFIWRNDASVFIGRNQIPWNESHLLAMQEDKIALCRRLSGGGAVFHDKGTISLSYITDRDHFQKSTLIHFLQEFLTRLGISTISDERHNLFLHEGPIDDGASEHSKLRKIAGSAFRFVKQRALHHVSLLFDCDEKTMWRYLRKSELLTTDTRATRSIRNRVGAIASHIHSIENLLHELVLAARAVFREPFYFIDGDGVDQSLVEYKSSWEWLIEPSPQHFHDLLWHRIPYRCVFRDGCVAACYNLLNGKMRTDILGQQLFTKLTDHGVNDPLQEHSPTDQAGYDFFRYIEEQLET